MVDLQHRLGRDFAEHGARSIQHGGGMRMAELKLLRVENGKLANPGPIRLRSGQAFRQHPHSARFACTGQTCRMPDGSDN